MKIHPKKCEFVVTLVVYLGHKILPNGIMVHWAKVVVIFITRNFGFCNCRMQLNFSCM
jgi:hypothetical protein